MKVFSFSEEFAECSREDTLFVLLLEESLFGLSDDRQRDGGGRAAARGGPDGRGVDDDRGGGDGDDGGDDDDRGGDDGDEKTT